jgi:hypothetical protein
VRRGEGTRMCLFGVLTLACGETSFTCKLLPEQRVGQVGPP